MCSTPSGTANDEKDLRWLSQGNKCCEKAIGMVHEILYASAGVKIFRRQEFQRIVSGEGLLMALCGRDFWLEFPLP